MPPQAGAAPCCSV